MFLIIFKIFYFAILSNTILYAMDGKSRRKFYIDILRECNRALSVCVRTKSLSIRNKNILRNNSTILSANNMLILVFCFIIPLLILIGHFKVDFLDGNLLNIVIATELVLLGSIIVLSQTVSLVISFMVIVMVKISNGK